MKIYSMTATFGKLEGAKLTLKPGLNLIYAPNEWGKSTWCAFLLAMFYGIDTRAKSTRRALADKEHYAPWSGLPMSGSIELEWQGRNITIQRESRGRIPMGSFRAFETDTGLGVPELTAENCGEMLLGVERSVFQRAGFVRLPELPVSEDDALRQRLNALVTTGDESGDGARLEQALRTLKNRCSYHRTGLIPQAEQEREDLRRQLTVLQELSRQLDAMHARLEENRVTQEKLENHMAALRYAQAREDAGRIARAEQAYAEADRKLREQETACSGLPDRSAVEEQLKQLAAFREKRARRLAELQAPENPIVPNAFMGMGPEAAVEQAQEDAERMKTLRGPTWWILLMLACIVLVSGLVLLFGNYVLPAVLAGVLFVLLTVMSLMCRHNQQREAEALIQKYGSDDSEKWTNTAKSYREAMEAYQKDWYAYRKSRAELLAGGEAQPDEQEAAWRELLQTWKQLDAARADVQRAGEQLELLRSMVRPMPEAVADDMTENREETERLLRQTVQERHQLQTRLGEIQGQMSGLETGTVIRQKLEDVEKRIARLVQTHTALTLAQQTLQRAEAALQRRFAPRIAKTAQTYLAQMTGGWYDRLLLDEDFSLQAGAAEENTLRDAQWRSDGTMDQLYLSVRLAVAQALTPEAPMVLDDALVRFDEERLDAALELLQDISEEKQVIVFSCRRLQ